MNIFGVGAPELILIFIIALIVAGPQRMIRWAYYLGKWSAKLRAMWGDIMKVVQHEIDQAGLDIEVPKNIPTRKDVGRMIEQAAKPYIKPVEETMNELKQVETEARSTAAKTRLELDNLGGELKNTAKAAQAATTTTTTTTTPANEPAQNGSVDFGTWSKQDNS